MKDEIVFKNLKTLISHNIPKSDFFKKKNKVEPEQMIFFGHHNWTMVFLSKFHTFIFFRGSQHDHRNTKSSKKHSFKPNSFRRRL